MSYMRQTLLERAPVLTPVRRLRLLTRFALWLVFVDGRWRLPGKEQSRPAGAFSDLGYISSGWIP